MDLPLTQLGVVVMENTLHPSGLSVRYHKLDQSPLCCMGVFKAKAEHQFLPISQRR